MAHHDHHNHEHGPSVQGSPVDPEETKRLRAEALAAGTTKVGWALGKAADAKTQYRRTFWLGKVDSARYMEVRAKAREKLSRTARRNMEADARLLGTEAEVNHKRTVGNAVVLVLVLGDKAPAGFTLIRRISGETGTEDHGPPRAGQWVVQGLRMNVVHEFAAVSHDGPTAKSVNGPWIAVPIGKVSTKKIQDAEKAEAIREHQEREAAEREKERQHAEEAARRRREQEEARRKQEEAARKDRERREREWERKKAAHEKAKSELHLVGPRDLKTELRDRGLPLMDMDITFKRGKKAPDIYQFQLNGTVLGYYPDGRHSGRKRADHVYRRTVQVPRGQTTILHVYGVTKHGDGGEPIEVKVPKSLKQQATTRMDQIIEASRTFTGRRTRREKKPYLRELRKHAGMPDITGAERDEAHRRA